MCKKQQVILRTLKSQTETPNRGYTLKRSDQTRTTIDRRQMGYIIEMIATNPKADGHG
jgi:hypothetical protein